MRRAHTVEQVRAAEADLMSRLPEGTLMQRAATGLAHACLEILGRAYGARVLLLVGSGANGGDALYAGALMSRRGALVEALLLSPDRAHRGGVEALRGAGGRVVTDLAEVSLDARPDVVVDGIVGIGGSGGLRDDAVAALRAVEGVPVVAVDTPSGVGVDDGTLDGAHVTAAATVTFGTHKICHLVDPAAAACGAVHLVDLGLDLPDAPVEALQARDVADLLPVPAGDAHKYTRGVVGLRTGSAAYPGAAVLGVAGASLCGLAGMVRYDGSAGDAVVRAHPEVVVGAGRVQAWVVGSGGGDEVADHLARSLSDGVPVVLDAEALPLVDFPLAVPAVLTPHAGELAAMLDVERAEVEARQLESVRRAADRLDAVVLLKGRRTLIAEPHGRMRSTATGTSWLATAGSGDVLAGLVGALLAAGLAPFDAASVGAWLHGAAGTVAGRGGPLTASRVADALPRVVADLVG